jgi:hypothetical protein
MMEFIYPDGAYRNMDSDELLDFIVDSKRKGYASGKSSPNKTMKGSHEIFIQKNDLAYRDVWFGSLTFTGIETVLQNDKPVWGMAYSGGILDEDGNKEKIFSFLKKALYLVDREAPYRGPKSYTDGIMTYHNEFSGEFDYFMGYESIEDDSGITYELHYSGGSIIE